MNRRFFEVHLVHQVQAQLRDRSAEDPVLVAAPKGLGGIHGFLPVLSAQHQAYEPAEGWKPSPWNEEKERIKELVDPVYEWVKTLK